MAINLLIDTSTLLQLLNLLEEDRNLHKLTVWVSRQEIQLYIPDILLTEWEYHKREKLEQIKTNVNKIKNCTRSITPFPALKWILLRSTLHKTGSRHK